MNLNYIFFIIIILLNFKSIQSQVNDYNDENYEGEQQSDSNLYSFIEPDGVSGMYTTKF
jgi:hypothetical protein